MLITFFSSIGPLLVFVTLERLRFLTPSLPNFLSTEERCVTFLFLGTLNFYGLTITTFLLDIYTLALIYLY